MNKFKTLKLADKIATSILIIGGLFALVTILSGLHSYINYYKFHTINLDNSNIKNIVAEKFSITQNSNIDLYQFGYDAEDGKMYVLIKDVENIHDFYFENLSYYNYTEEEFKEKFNRPFSHFSNVHSMFFGGDNYQGTGTYIKNDEKSIELTLFKCDGILYCELAQKIDWAFVSELSDLQK